ncbi:Endonuclease/exonuclease/phosphatase [Parasitella parasitica]|nr:Endonuclease/exonuclease/phosphatase [Parasitella parasitica]
MSEEHAQHPKKPNNIDELKRLKQLKKEAKKRLNSKPQVEQSPPGKVFERPFAAVPDQPILDSPSGQVRVMTFNILAQSLIKRNLFPDSGDFIKWKQRRRMVLDEIKLYNPDVLTMQELDNFEAYFEAKFAEMGYQVLYYTHPTKRHGCGIAFKTDKFDYVEYDTVDYNTDALCRPSYMTGNIAQLLALRLKSNPDIGFVVGNTHLYWRPSSNYERFRQTIIYSNHLLEFKEKQSATTKWEPLLLGDFNTTPDDAAYGLLTTSQLSDFHIEDLNASRTYKPSADDSQNDQEDEEGDGEQSVSISVDELDSVESLLAKYQNDSKWKSIYSHVGSVNADPNSLGLFGEPRFTHYASQFQGTLDYMFIDCGSSLRIKSLLLMPDEQEHLRPSLPNKYFGSDHLCLVADLEL